jgi:hypothetical protein
MFICWTLKELTGQKGVSDLFERFCPGVGRLHVLHDSRFSWQRTSFDFHRRGWN